MDAQAIPPDADSTEKGSVLIVDDNENIIFVIQEALGTQGIELYSATSGREALRILGRTPMDLVLLDARMPEINGFDVCKQIKNTPELRGVKVMIISASNSPEDKLRAFHNGADDYMTKPFRTKEFQARVNVMLNLRRAEQELTARSRQLEELLRVSQIITQRLDLRTVTDEIVRSAASLVNADHANLVLWDETKGVHRYTAMVPDTIPPFVGEEIAADSGIASEVFRTGQPVIVADYSTYDKRVPGVPVESTRAIAGVPLYVKGRHIGVLSVDFATPDRHFRQSDIDALLNLANQAAIAIENAKLYGDLRASEEKYRLLTEKASDPIFILDPNGIITYTNERVQTLLGYSPGTLLGKHYSIIIAADQREAVRQSFERTINAATERDAAALNQPIIAAVMTPNGASVVLEFNLGLLYEGEALVNIQAIARDVTERQRAEEHERMRAMGRLAAGVAHDFNNLLSSILGHAELLSQETTDPVVRDTLKIIQQAAQDGGNIVRRIHESSGQREAGLLDRVDVNEVVRDAIELTRPRWRDESRLHGITITIEEATQNVPPITGNEVELREVLINLINNAIDALPDSGIIRFTTYADEKSVYVSVYDNGKGMSSEIKRHVFEPFYTTKGLQGTGLGLSVAQGILQRHNGEFLEIESSPDGGTTITVRLPIETRPAASSAEPSQSFQAGVEQFLPTPITPPIALPAPQPRLHPIVSNNADLTILAVDDELQLRTIMARALTRSGYKVVTASNGTEALDLFNRHNVAPDSDTQPFSMVFTDLGMPGMSGWEVAQALKRLDPDIPIVIVTGWGELLDSQKLHEYGVSRTIAKPFSLSDITNTAKDLLANPN